MPLRSTPVTLEKFFRKNNWNLKKQYYLINFFNFLVFFYNFCRQKFTKVICKNIYLNGANCKSIFCLILPLNLKKHRLKNNDFNIMNWGFFLVLNFLLIIFYCVGSWFIYYIMIVGSLFAIHGVRLLKALLYLYNE